MLELYSVVAFTTPIIFGTINKKEKTMKIKVLEGFTLVCRLMSFNLFIKVRQHFVRLLAVELSTKFIQSRQKL
jgi:hypothetical protein